MEDILIVTPKKGDIVRVFRGSPDHWVIGEVHAFYSEAKMIYLILPPRNIKGFNFSRFDSIEILSTPGALFRLLVSVKSLDKMPQIVGELQNIARELRNTRSFAKSKTIKNLRERLEKVIGELS